MKLTLLTLGKWKEPAMRELFHSYAGRIQPRLELVELELPLREQKGDIKAAEGALLLKHWPKSGTVVCCDERGKAYDSRAFSAALQDWQDKRGLDIAFVIGGADGLHGSVLQKADGKISLGAMVWPHLFVRVMLAEQLYRAQTILSGHPYHRD